MRRALIAVAGIVLAVGLFVAIVVMEPTFCDGMDAECWEDRWRVAVGFGSLVIAITRLLLSIPLTGRPTSRDRASPRSPND